MRISYMETGYSDMVHCDRIFHVPVISAIMCPGFSREEHDGHIFGNIKIKISCLRMPLLNRVILILCYQKYVHHVLQAKSWTHHGRNYSYMKNG